ncbi:MAG: 2-dehydropantoate 2-reductase [Candidatus Rokuibacteriota bacterium]|nr:MAG: 2-dehydropantoate 2-reductase [Candidatus Rokubacteria bacterium]PYN68535.1 MAG: 2-dehydropantoate 2-reductase [Candidatus Rokubacteria bacterium]
MILASPRGGPPIQVTVYGAGAIGGYTGAALARAGHEVLLVDLAEAHVAELKESGLTIETPEGRWTARVHAITPQELGGQHDLVLLAVKSQHTADALKTLVPHLAPRGIIVSLQNGLNEELIARQIGAWRTLGCLVNWGADWLAPGRVRYGGPGAFVLGELDGAIGPRVKELGRLLAPVAELRLSDNVRGYKWAKHVYGALLFATALVDAHVYEVVERSRPVQRMLVALVAEGMALAAAARVRLEAFDEYDPELYRAAHGGDTAALDAAMAAVAHHYRTRTKTKTGIWRDLAVRKRKTEADGLFRVALEKAAQLRVPMPLTRRMIELIHDLEEGRRPMAWENLDELVALSSGTPRSHADGPRRPPPLSGSTAGGTQAGT